MIITPEYCISMARYNAWQNKQLKAAFAELSEKELGRTRKAFFGSILGTANHILWGDRIWMARFTGGTPPKGGIADSVDLTPSGLEWNTARFRTDGDILTWAERLRALDLTGDLSWHSGALGKSVARPMAICVVHMFNHQTHHRGQIHTMLTAAGVREPVSDLAFMPDEGPWL